MLKIAFWTFFKTAAHPLPSFTHESSGTGLYGNRTLNPTRRYYLHRHSIFIIHSRICSITSCIMNMSWESQVWCDYWHNIKGTTSRPLTSGHLGFYWHTECTVGSYDESNFTKVKIKCNPSTVSILTAVLPLTVLISLYNWYWNALQYKFKKKLPPPPPQNQKIYFIKHIFFFFPPFPLCIFFLKK